MDRPNFITENTITRHEVLLNLNEFGIAVIEGYADGSVLKSLNEEFSRFHSTPDTDFKELTEYSKGICARVNRLSLDESQYPETCNFFSSSFMEGIAKNYLRGEINLNSSIFVVKDVIGSDHIANDLHYDINQTLKFFLYLTDTKEENGSFTCVPGSHIKTREYRDKYGNKISYENRDISRNLDLDLFDEAVPIEGPAGTLIIFDTDVWHKAGKVSSGERRVMRGHTSAAAQKRPHKYKDLLRKIGIR